VNCGRPGHPPIGALIGTIAAVGSYDAVEAKRLYDAIRLSRDPVPPGTGQTKCKNDADCEEEWKEAREMCREMLSRPHPPRGMTGGYKDIENCARGLVSEACGGNPVDRGGSK
jgi:hypothetical protein